MSYYVQGAYYARVTEQGFAESQNGNPQFYLSILILGPKDADIPPCNQYDRKIIWTITDKTIDFIVEKLNSIGFTGQAFRELDPSQPTYHSFVDQEIEVYCKLETYEGKERERWDLARNLELELKPLDSGKVRQLDAMFGRKLADANRSSAPPQKREPPKSNLPPSAQTYQTVPEDDEIPF